MYELLKNFKNNSNNHINVRNIIVLFPTLDIQTSTSKESIITIL